MVVGWFALMLAQAGAAVPPPPHPVATVQQAFDAATTLDAKGTPAERAAAWHALGDRVKGNRRTVAIVDVREGRALVAAGRDDEGEALVRHGLADLPAADATLREDRYDALLVLGAVAEQRIDYADAAARYAEAERAAETPAERFGAILAQIRTATYTDPDAAVAAVGRADALMATLKVEPGVAAMVRRFHAELLLNRGDTVGAKAQAAAAVKLQGGLTSRTDSEDVSARSDYAIASLILGDSAQAREYMAMTGAGRIPNGVFGRGVDTNVPDCGGEAGLKPADLAVVEFTVADDGRTIGVRPVYAAGGGAVALEFARAVTHWSWTPEQLKDVPIFFRNRVRLELRCSTSFARPSIDAYLDTRLGRWLADQDVEMPPIPAGSEAAALPVERGLLAAAEARSGKEAPTLVPILHLIVRNRVTPRDERHAAATRELAILEARHAPPLVRLGANIAAVDSLPDHERAAFQQLASRYAGDAEAAGALALINAERNGRSTTQARAWLQPIAANATLGNDNPIRTAALIRLASLDERAGDPDAARALYAQANIPPESCALIDARPQLLHVGGTFPMEAMHWGFEGWTQIQYDISPAGKVSNARAVIAYPPFVFTKAGIATMVGATYAKTYRPDGQLGCGGETGNVRFRLP